MDPTMPLRRILLSLAAAFGLGLGSVALATPARSWTASASRNGRGSGAATSLQITPGTAVLTVGHSQSFKADAVLGSGNPHPAHPQWSAPQGGTITQEGRFTAPASPGTYGVQADFQGLTASARVTVVPAPDATITVPPIVTQGAAGLTASVPNQPGSTYAWTAAYGSIVSGASGPVATFAAPSAGTLQLKCRVTNAAGDSAQSVVTVQVVPPPQILSFTVSRPIITVGDTITAQVSFINGQGDLEPGVGAVASGATLTLQPTQSVVYTLTVTNAAGTSVAVSQSVTVVPPPDATLTTPSGVTAGLSGFQASVPTQPSSTYAWTISNGALAASNTPQVTFTAGTVGSLQIGCTVTNAAGRAATGTRTLSVLPMPVITAFSAAPSVITLGATSTLGFQFQNGNGRVDPALGPVTPGSSVVKPQATTTYVLTVDNGAGGVATQNAVVTVVPPPDPTITADKIETQGTPGHVATVPDAQGSTFAWTVTGGLITAGQGTRQLTYAAGTGATVTLQCIVTNAAGTSATGTSTAQLVTPPDSTLTVPATVTTGAVGLNAAVPDQPGCTFSWTVSGGAITAGDGTHAITFTAGAVGTLHVACTVTNAAGTASTGAQDIQAVAAPSIQAFTATPAALNAGQASTLAFTFSGGTGSLDHGIGAVQSGVSMGVMPTATTTYTLSVTNPAGAVATQTATVTVNASTPGSVVFNTPSVVRLTLAGTYSFFAHIIGTGGRPPALRGMAAPAATAQPVVVWSVQEPGGGTIDGGFYTAPMTPGTYHVVATNSLDATKFAVATVLVIAPNPAISISVAPGSTATGINTPVALSALVQGTTNQAVDWVLQRRVGATLTPQGNQAAFQASVSGAYTVLAASQADPSKSVEAFINVNDPGAPVINSFTTSLPSIPAGAATTLSWSVTGATTITVDGLNVTGQTSESVKPTAPYDYLLVATNAAGSSFAQVHVDVQAPTIQLFTADQTSVPVDGTVNLTAYFFNGQGQVDQGVGPITSGVPVPVKPNGNTTYTLTVTNALGAITQAQLAIKVTVPGAISLGGPMAMNSNYYDFQSAQLYDGRVLSFFGMSDQSNLYDPAHATSSIAAGVPASSALGGRRYPAFSVMTDGRLLLGGGYSNGYGSPTASDWAIYDPAANTFTSIAGPLAQEHALVSLLDGRVLLASGINGHTSAGWPALPSGSFVFDPTQANGSLGQWQAVTGDTGIAWSTLWGSQTTLLADGRVLLSNGKTCTGIGTWSDDHLVGLFDPAQNSISILGKLDASFYPSWPDLDASQGMRTYQLPLPDGKVLFMGSAVGSWIGWMFPAAIFDPATSQLTRLQGPRARLPQGQPQVLPNGLIVFLDWFPGESDAQVYDSVRNIFYSLAQIPDMSNWYQQQQSVLLQDGRIFWPGLSVFDSVGNASPGTVRLFTYPFDLTITPWIATTNVGIPVQLKATTKDGNPASWSASGGTIDPVSGVFKASTPGLYVITATDDQGRVAHARVQVNPPIVVQVSPSVATVPKLSTFQFNAHLSNTPDQAVTWSVVEGAAGGSIDPQTGLYTAPAVVGVYHVMATSVLNPTASATAEVDVVPVTVSLTPAYIELLPGSSFSLSVTTNAGGVSWQASEGSISTSGVFTAPTQSGIYIVTATSLLDSTVQATSKIIVRRVSILVSPNQITLAKGGTYHFLALTTSGGVNWSTSGGGSITSDGTYTAPATDGNYQVVATSAVDSNSSAFASITVQDGGVSSGGNTSNGSQPPSPTYGGVRIDPSVSQMTSGAYKQFFATAYGVKVQGVRWDFSVNIRDTISGELFGTIDQDGNFTAGAPGIYVLRATSLENSQLVGTAVVQVVSGVDRVFSAPATLNREYYSVTALQDGRILIAGGYDGANYLGSCYLFDPSSNTFTATGSLVFPRSAHKAVLLSDGRVLVSQGVGNRDPLGDPLLHGSGYLPCSEIYDPKTGLWTTLPEMSISPNVWSVNIGGAAIPFDQDKALILGGDPTQDQPHPSASFFDGAGFSFIDWNTLGWGKWFPMVRLKDGRAFYSGGYTSEPRPTGSLDTDWEITSHAAIYNPSDGSVVTAGDMTSKRLGHTATMLADGRVLIVGGISHNQTPYGALTPDQWVPTASAEIYDPSTGTYTQTGSLELPRTDHAAVLLPTGEVMVVGGWMQMSYQQDGTPVYLYQNSVETYNPTSGTWRVTDLMKNGDTPYGLDSPKLAMKKDGGVFIAGRPIQADGSTTPITPVREGASSLASKTALCAVRGGATKSLIAGEPVAALAANPAGSMTTLLAVFDQMATTLKGKLSVLRPDGTEVSQEEATTDGVILQVNKKEDTSLPPTTDDYLRLKLHKLNAADTTGLSYHLHFGNKNIAIWSDVNKSQSIVSDQTAFSVDQDSMVYVEGLAPSLDMNGEAISLQVIKDGKVLTESKANIVVAQMVFAILGDGQTGGNVLYNYSYDEEDGIDERSDPNLFIIRRPTSCFSVRLGKTQNFATMALSATDAYVVYDGHSNFGIGFAFSKNMTHISDFMNLGKELVAIEWPYMRSSDPLNGQDQTNFWIEDSEYAGNLSVVPTGPYMSKGFIAGIHDSVAYANFTSQSTASFEYILNLTRGTYKYLDYYWPSPNGNLIVAKGGAADMPPKRWKKLFLNACRSGEYYAATMNYGTLFYTTNLCSDPHTTTAFVAGVLDGKDDEGIWLNITGIEKQNDYQVFTGVSP